jgi:hypothetical protein
MTNASTTVKIVVSMVVVAALAATRFSSSKVRYGRNGIVHGAACLEPIGLFGSNVETVMCLTLFGSPR